VYLQERRNRHRLGNRLGLRQSCLALLQLHHLEHGQCSTSASPRHMAFAPKTCQQPLAEPETLLLSYPSTIPPPTTPSFPPRCCLHAPVFDLRHTPIHLSCSTSPSSKSKPRSGVEAQVPLHPEAVTLPPSPSAHPRHDQCRNHFYTKPSQGNPPIKLQVLPFRPSQPRK